MMKKNPNPKKQTYQKKNDKKRIEKLLKWYGVDLTTLNLKEKEVNKK